MSLMRKEISEVFTPRSPDVNRVMYVNRAELEVDLYRSVKGSMHTFLCGESGNGKSWLYKKVFEEKKIQFVVANCANASRLKSITKEISDVCATKGAVVKTGYKETKDAEVGVGFAKGSISHEGEFSIVQVEPLLAAFQSLNEKSGGARSVIVLDNVEAIFENKDLMDELSDMGPRIIGDRPRFNENRRNSRWWRGCILIPSSPY